MIFEIVFTPEAEQTFDSVSEQISLAWGQKVLYDFEDKMLKSLTLVSRNPLLYPIIFQPLKVRRCILHKNCSMLYRVMGSSVEIVCFGDNKQKPIF
jgi:hypothetical protein